MICSSLRGWRADISGNASFEASRSPDRKEADTTIAVDRIDAVRGYSILQIGLHWLIAVLVLVQLVFGEGMAAFVEAAEEGEPVSATDADLAGVHYYFGIAILALVAVRLALRFGRGVPPAPEASRALELAAGFPIGCFMPCWS